MEIPISERGEKERFGMYIFAQISLYPLKQQSISPALEVAWRIIEENRLDYQKGEMSTVVRGASEVVSPALQKVFLRAAEKGPLSMVVTFSNACPMPAEEDPSK